MEDLIYGLNEEEIKKVLDIVVKNTTLYDGLHESVLRTISTKDSKVLYTIVKKVKESKEEENAK